MPDDFVVLVVEDEPLLRWNLSECLTEDLDVQVLEAPDGEAALEALEKLPEISFVVADIRMPGAIDGLALSYRIKQLYPDVEVLLTSGHFHPHSGALPAGVSFIPKPYSAEEILTRIAAAAQRKLRPN
jgi:CheY-like chemotaxis protein